MALTRLAGIDCGTNSIRLLIADVEGERLRDVHREMRIVRLGQGVDATGEFAPEAISRTRAALVDYAGLLRLHGVERVRMVATSATRDAANRDVFFAMTAEVLGAVNGEPGLVFRSGGEVVSVLSLRIEGDVRAVYVTSSTGFGAGGAGMRSHHSREQDRHRYLVSTHFAPCSSSRFLRARNR